MLYLIYSAMVPTRSSGILVAVGERRERSRTKRALEDRARALRRRSHSNTKQTGMYTISIIDPPEVFGAAALVMHWQRQLVFFGDWFHCVRVVNLRAESDVEVTWNFQ